MINVKLVGDREFILKLEAMPPMVLNLLRRKITELSLKLQNKIQTEKLSGQVLNVKTGALRRSIHSQTTSSPSRVIGQVLSSGDVKYGAIHEFGFSGTEKVGAHSRRITQAFGRPIEAKTIAISAHSRKMNMPVRSFMRTSLKEMTPEISAGMKAAVIDGIKAAAGRQS